jgi:hypothetical protein
MVNTVIGNWRIERKLDQAGLGEGYLARHSNLCTFAALQILSTSLTGEPKFRRLRVSKTYKHGGKNEKK